MLTELYTTANGATGSVSAIENEEVLMLVEGWLWQVLGAVVMAAVAFGVAWLIFVSVKGFFDGMTRGLRGEDEEARK